MSRTLKNILTVLLIMVLLGTSCLTLYFAKGSNYFGNRNFSSESIDGNLPENKGDNTFENSDSSEKPEMPTGEMSEDFSNGQQPPEIPSGESGETQDTQQPPEMPDGENDGDMKSSDGGDFRKNKGEKSLFGMSTLGFILLVIQALALSSAVLYLILSGFNKKAFKETFKSKSRIVICIFASLVLACGLTFAEIYVSKSIASPVFSERMKRDNNGEKPQFSNDVETTTNSTQN